MSDYRPVAEWDEPITDDHWTNQLAAWAEAVKEGLVHEQHKPRRHLVVYRSSDGSPMYSLPLERVMLGSCTD